MQYNVNNIYFGCRKLISAFSIRLPNLFPKFQKIKAAVAVVNTIFNKLGAILENIKYKIINSIIFNLLSI